MENTFRSVGQVGLWSVVAGIVLATLSQAWWETEPLVPNLFGSIVLMGLGSGFLGSLIALTFLDPGHDEETL